MLFTKFLKISFGVIENQTQVIILIILKNCVNATTYKQAITLVIL